MTFRIRMETYNIRIERASVMPVKKIALWSSLPFYFNTTLVNRQNLASKIADILFTHNLRTNNLFHFFHGKVSWSWSQYHHLAKVLYPYHAHENTRVVKSRQAITRTESNPSCIVLLIPVGLLFTVKWIIVTSPSVGTKGERKCEKKRERMKGWCSFTTYYI